MDIKQVTERLQDLAQVDAKDQAAREARDIERAELCHAALREEAYKEVSKSISEYAKVVGLTRSYLYNLANVWDSDAVRPHIQDLGPARAIELAQAEKNGLDTEIVESYVEKAPTMKVKDLKSSLRAEQEVPDEAKSKIELMEELEKLLADKRRLQEKMVDLEGRIKEVQKLVKEAK